MATAPVTPSPAIDPNDVEVHSAGIDPNDVDVEPVRSPDEEASATRQMLVSGLTGMPTPNMNAYEKGQFEQGKAAGAVSVPAVALGTAGASAGIAALPEAIGSAAKAAIPHVVALGQWAEANPGMAKILLEGIKLAGFGGALAMIRRMQ